jgi:hypothetical protein
MDSSGALAGLMSETLAGEISNTWTDHPVNGTEHGDPFGSRDVGIDHDRAAQETPMRRLWLALFATVPLLLLGIGTASAQMRSGNAHGSGTWHGGGWHGGQFHDGRFFLHGRRFDHFRSNFSVFIGAPAVRWGAPSYFYQYPYADYTDPSGDYPPAGSCTNGWLKAVPAGAPMPSWGS